MLYTHQSNCLEILTDRLADLMAQPLRSPLAGEIIVTQSNGLARWLTLQLADRLGVCAHLDFRFPAVFLWDMARRVLHDLPPTSAFDRPVLNWRVMAKLQEIGDEPCFAPVRTWLGDGYDDFRYYELACRIADRFDQYLIYRPNWITEWESGVGQHWQAELWRRLAKDGAGHRVQVQEQFRQALRRGALNRRRLPERVAIIGLSALAPLHLDLLAELAHLMDIHLFLLNPCQEYWGDIRAERELARLGEDLDPDADYLVTGHPLLASLGKQGRDFIDLVQDYPRTEWDGFVEPAGEDLLHRLQADILHLRERGAKAHPRITRRPDDRSIQVHVCHGPMREVEVLHDQLLALFEAHRELRPADVVVMAPDIARYGPLIEAVFDAAPRERRIPFSIADQGLPVENPLVETFFQLLDLNGERFDAAQVMGLLEPPAVRRRFGLDESDLVRIRQWVREVGIRWGINADIKKDRWALPATAEHTWQAGLDRLLLGYALPGQGRELYADILPYDEVEGGEAQALGGLQSFLNELFELHHRLRAARPPAEWIAALHGLLDRFFAAREREENQLQLIRSALEELAEPMEQAQFVRPVSLSVIKSALRNLLNTPESGIGRFPSGGITCCAMVPMRSIPFAVVCLIGMNDDAFPRPDPPSGFDLMAGAFRRGDRSRRRDDRYLFLETLLSARRCFYLSYVGQNIRDNSVLPPSVLVSELLELIDRSVVPGTGSQAGAPWVIRHPLQPFSRRYFSGDGHLFSYAGEWLEASRQAGRGERDARALLAAELPEPELALRQMTLDGLIQFFKNPARWLLRERLGIRVDEGEEALETREPFVPDALSGYQMLDEMLELYREGRSATDMAIIMRTNGALPHGQVGECVFAGALERVERFAGRLGPLFPRRQGAPLELDLSVGDFRLTGRLSGMTPDGWVGYRLAKIKAGDYLKLWLHHLVLHLVERDEDRPQKSYWVAEDRLITLNPVEQPRALLQELLDHYWQGAQRVLHFFPRSALAYMERLRQDKEPNPDQALWAARRIWEGEERQPGIAERDNAYYQLAFGETDPLDEEFIRLSQAVFGPLFAHLLAGE